MVVLPKCANIEAQGTIVGEHEAYTPATELNADGYLMTPPWSAKSC